MRLFAILFLTVSLSLFVSGQQSMFHQDVSWSPDSKYITFTGLHDYDSKTDSFKTDIYVMRVDGSGLRKITSDDANDYYTSWGKGRIVFSSGPPSSKESDIFTINPDGSQLRQVTNVSGKDSTPAFSRDGKRIAFVSMRDGGKYQIYTMNSDGSKVKRLTNDTSTAFVNPQWSPDGKAILYYSDKGDGKDQVWTMRSDGSDQKVLTGNLGHNIFPGWSSDGKRIIFAASKRDKDQSGSYVDASRLYTMNADGSDLKLFANIQSFFARFSPDGKHVAYIAGKFPTNSIYIANADGSGAVKVTQ